MVRRDPQTGQFVSGGEDAADDRLTGSISSTVPAADLSGGTASQAVDGETAEVIDFTQVLDSDEVFEVAALTVEASLSLPTTATAESAAQLNWTVSNDLGASQVINPVHYGNSAMEEQGIADVRAEQWDDDGTLATGHLVAESSVGDSTNGLGAGAENDRERIRIPFWGDYGSGPVFDQNDELTAPHQFYIDNVDDHAVLATIVCHLEGNVTEV